jgi:hypothetical protein
MDEADQAALKKADEIDARTALAQERRVQEEREGMFAEELQAQADRERNMDAMNPNHYKSHPSGVECIQITEHLDFLTGNAMKYLWRAGQKDNKIQDLEKSIWYINRLIEKEKKIAYDNNFRHRDDGDPEFWDTGHREYPLHCSNGIADGGKIFCRFDGWLCEPDKDIRECRHNHRT